MEYRVNPGSSGPKLMVKNDEDDGGFYDVDREMIFGPDSKLIGFDEKSLQFWPAEDAPQCIKDIFPDVSILRAKLGEYTFCYLGPKSDIDKEKHLFRHLDWIWQAKFGDGSTVMLVR